MGTDPAVGPDRSGSRLRLRLRRGQLRAHVHAGIGRAGGAGRQLRTPSLSAPRALSRPALVLALLLAFSAGVCGCTPQGSTTEPILEGRAAIAGSSESVYDGESAEGIPFKVYEVGVPQDETGAAEQVKLSWTGESSSNELHLFVHNASTGEWDAAKTKTSVASEGKLAEATVDSSYVDGGKIYAMVQSGAGYAGGPAEANAASAGEGSANGQPRTASPGDPAAEGEEAPAQNPLPKGNDEETPRDGYDFTIVVQSDPQYYSEAAATGGAKARDGAKGEYYTDMEDWVVANRESKDIRYVAMTGDLVQNSDAEGEWEFASNAMKKLEDAGVPYGVLAGNHDVGAGHDYSVCDYSVYGRFFGKDRFEDLPWYGSSYESNRCHYDLVSAQGIDFVFVYLGWNVRDKEIKWANKVFARYPERVGVLCVHYYLAGGDTVQVGSGMQPVHDRIVAANPNVKMVLCGHSTNSQHWLEPFDDNGDGQSDRQVLEMLFDYQHFGGGGLGYMRLMHFDNESRRVIVRTYSPSFDEYDIVGNPAAIGAPTGQEDFAVTYNELGIEPAVHTLADGSFEVAWAPAGE